MSRLLLNTNLNPIFDRNGAPVVSGGVVMSDELADGQALDGLVPIKPGDVPEQSSILTPGAYAHVEEWRKEQKPKRRGNAERASGDDSTVRQSTEKGGES